LIAFNKVLLYLAFLTISGHANRDTFLESAVLASVPVYPHDVTLLVLEAWSILNLLLYAAPEETLK